MLLARILGRGRKTEQKPPSVTVEGVRADEGWPDEEAVYAQACAMWEETRAMERKRASQVIRFDHGPICLVGLADQHLGSDGTDIQRVFAEAELVRDTPGMYAILLGDLGDTFVWPSLLPVRLMAHASIPDEWALMRRYLKVIAPKLVASVSGNHQEWTRRLVGIDYFRDVLASVRPECVYDTDDARVRIEVGEASWGMRIRHKWRGSSIYNPTHGIERAFKWDQDFEIGFGAHIHACGVVRSFNAAGGNGMALMCGSYKRVDDYARRLGLAKQNASTAVAVLLDEATHSLTGFDNLEMAARVIRELQR